MGEGSHPRINVCVNAQEIGEHSYAATMQTLGRKKARSVLAANTCVARRCRRRGIFGAGKAESQKPQVSFQRVRATHSCRLTPQPPPSPYPRGASPASRAASAPPPPRCPTSPGTGPPARPVWRRRRSGCTLSAPPGAARRSPGRPCGGHRYGSGCGYPVWVNWWVRDHAANEERMTPSPAATETKCR